MGTLCNAGEDLFLDHVFRNTGSSWTTPATVYLALWVGDPGENGDANAEVADANGYARVAIAFGVAASRVITQNAIVQYAEASGAWGTVDNWVITDSGTHGGGNALAYGAFSSSKAIISGNTPSVASGQIEITVTAGKCSTNFANAMLEHIFNSTTYTPPAAVNVVLSTAAIADANAGTDIAEFTMTGYTSQDVKDDADWDAAADGVTANATLIDFGQLTSTTETVEAIALVDSATTDGSEIMVYDNTPSQAIGDGDTVQIPIGDFDITLT